MLSETVRAATVVVCEDDELTREFLCDNLTADRFEVLPAATAAAALRLCRYETPDLLLLDLNLPDASGLDVLREIRATEAAPAFDPDLPVVVLSGRGDARERIRGLREGADDYLVKPFDYEELLLRVRSQLGRREWPRRGPTRVGLLTLDPATREVRVAGSPVELANKEFELLRILATDPRRVFTKDELLREIWGYQEGARTRTLDSHASRLRRKLDPEGSRYVINCWGVGYRLVEA